MIEIRVAKMADLSFLTLLEETCFVKERRFNKLNLKRSLLSQHQEVFILEYVGENAAAIITQVYPSSVRIYSVAVLPTYQKLSLGKALMNFIIERAKSADYQKVTLEADAKNITLIEWYQSFGFRIVREIKSYYGLNEPAYKMALILKDEPMIKKHMMNIVVTDQEIPWLKNIDAIKVVSAEQFINNESYQTLKGVRIFNLCNSYHYQTIGYYVSLLAAARNQRVIPNVTTIKDFSDTLIIESIGDEVLELIEKSLGNIKSTTFVLSVYFGNTEVKKYAKLAKALYKLFEAPLLMFTFEKGKTWNLKQVTPLSLSDVDLNVDIEESARQFFNQKRFTISRFKDYKYDLAILIDPLESLPPSCKLALSKFKHAAEKIGFYTEFITKEDYQRLSEFDALFIRVTTNVNDYSYQFSRYAYAEGLVVIDDPWSILKCSNKLYFAESMKRSGVLTPQTIIVSQETPIQNIVSQMIFPIVLKQPDSAFSLGVFKVHNEVELKNKLNELFITSELIVAQAFIQSDFDWRIGVLDNVPLYACKYYMAKNHWQIINWNSSSNRNQVGRVITLAIDEVPKHVIDTAIKAASIMGDGLYGVDLKEIDNKVFVIEVNDNPSIDYHWEDRVLEDELYLRIMKNMYSRIETARNIKRNVSQYR